MDKVVIKMLSTETGQFDEPLEAGQHYEISKESAQYWVVRNKAVMVDTTKPAEVETEVEEDAASMTVAQLKEALDAKGIEYPTGAKKADLQALHDAA